MDNEGNSMDASKHKVGVFDFNHVSPDLDDADVESLKRMHAHYHKLSVCYGWAYKNFKRLKTCLKMTSTFLTVCGAAMSPLSLITLVASGIGVMVGAYAEVKDVPSKMEGYHTAHVSYLKVLDDLRSYLRGLPYDHKVLISDLRVLDQIINHVSPSIPEKLVQKYERKYKEHSSST